MGSGVWPLAMATRPAGTPVQKTDIRDQMSEGDYAVCWDPSFDVRLGEASCVCVSIEEEVCRPSDL